MNTTAVISWSGQRHSLYMREHDVSYTPFLLILVNKPAGMETGLVSQQCSVNGCRAHGQKYKEPAAQLFDLQNRTIFGILSLYILNHKHIYYQNKLEQTNMKHNGIDCDEIKLD